MAESSFLGTWLCAAVAAAAYAAEPEVDTGLITRRVGTKPPATIVTAEAAQRRRGARLRFAAALSPEFACQAAAHGRAYRALLADRARPAAQPETHQCAAPCGLLPNLHMHSVDFGRFIGAVPWGRKSFEPSGRGIGRSAGRTAHRADGRSANEPRPPATDARLRTGVAEK